MVTSGSPARLLKLNVSLVPGFFRLADPVSFCGRLRLVLPELIENGRFLFKAVVGYTVDHVVIVLRTHLGSCQRVVCNNRIRVLFQIFLCPVTEVFRRFFKFVTIEILKITGNGFFAFAELPELVRCIRAVPVADIFG